MLKSWRNSLSLCQKLHSRKYYYI